MAKTKIERAAGNNEDPLLDFKEAAAQLGIDRITLWRWCQKDRFGRRRLRTVRYPSGRRKIRQSVVNQILLATGHNGDATEELNYEEQAKETLDGSR